MKKLGLLLLMLIALLARAEEAVYVLPHLRVERLPVRLMAPLPWPQRTEIVVAPGQVWVLAQANIWRLGATQGLFSTPLEVASFARSDAGTLVAIVGEQLGLVSKGLFLPAIALPEKDMRVVGGPGDTLYLHGTGAPARILGFDGDHVVVLASAADPITALTHLGDTVIYSTLEGVFALRPGMPPGLLFPLAGHAPLISLVANVETAELFGASEDSVYQLDEGRMTQIAHGLGGALAIVNRDLLVADVKRKRVFRLYQQGGQSP